MTISTASSFLNNGFELATTDWCVSVTADNLAATVTRAAESDKAHYVTAITASFSAASTKLLTIKDGATVIGSFYVVNNEVINFATPVKVSGVLEVSLAASGTTAVIGAVTVAGITA